MHKHFHVTVNTELTRQCEFTPPLQVLQESLQYFAVEAKVVPAPEYDKGAKELCQEAIDHLAMFRNNTWPAPAMAVKGVGNALDSLSELLLLLEVSANQNKEGGS